MGDDYVQVGADGAGKKLQTKSNVVGANTVHSEAVFQVDASGNAIAPALEGGNLATIAGKTDVALSTLAKETGGNLASCKSDLDTIATKETSIDGKVTKADTDHVTITGALPSGSNSLGSLSQSTKHDAKAYLTKIARVNATGLFSIAVGGKIVKVHSYSLQSESDSQSVYFYEETAGTQLSQKWMFNAREGVTRGFAAAPAQLFKTATQGKDLGINLANATYVNIEIQYSVDDAS